MRFFYSPGACSLVSHIALEEAGLEFQAIAVPIAERAHHEASYLAVNPRGLVPALEVDGQVVAETIAILTRLAGLQPGGPTLPLDDPIALARTYQFLSFFACSVHAVGFGSFYRARARRPEAAAALLAEHRPMLEAFFADIERLCAGGPWLLGDRYTAADGYPPTFLRWARRLDFDAAHFPGWRDHARRMVSRAAVQRALGREGLDASEF